MKKEFIIDWDSRHLKGDIDYEIWTDGSCWPNPGPGTAVAMIYQNNKLIDEKTCFEPETTNNRMEIMGVILGLKSLPDGSRVRFYCDNDYVVQGFNQWMHNWIKKDWKGKKNIDLFKTLYNEHKRLKATGIWVRGHSGIPRNELCDTRASELLETFTGIKPRY